MIILGPWKDEVQKCISKRYIFLLVLLFMGLLIHSVLTSRMNCSFVPSLYICDISETVKSGFTINKIFLKFHENHSIDCEAKQLVESKIRLWKIKWCHIDPGISTDIEIRAGALGGGENPGTTRLQPSGKNTWQLTHSEGAISHERARDVLWKKG